MGRYQFGEHGEKIVSVIRRELGSRVKPAYFEGRVELQDEEKGLVMAFIEDTSFVHCVFEKAVPLIEGVTEEQNESGSLKWHYRGSKVDEIMMLAMAAYRNL